MQLNVDEQTWSQLLSRQEKREDVAYADGAKRFREQVEKASLRGDATSTGAARKLLQTGIDPLSKAITEWLERRSHIKGARHVAEKWIGLVGADVAAYMTVRSVLSYLPSEQSYRETCGMISECIISELRYRRFKEKCPGLFEYKLRNFRTSNYAHMARSLDHALRTAVDDEGLAIDVSDLHITHHQRVQIGAKLIELLMDATSLVEVGRGVEQTGSRRAGKRVHHKVWLTPTEDTLKWLTDRNDGLALLAATNQPMVVPPIQWAPGQRGGYRFARKGHHALVRRVRDKEWYDKLANADLPIVYSALNAIQNTPWKINPHVVCLVRMIQERGGNLAGIPLSSAEELTPQPHDIATNDVARKAWRRQAHQVHERNHERKIKALVIERLMSVAEDVQDEGAIYFPYSLDFRGRVYPVADYLSPQGSDLSRALLLFAQGKAMDQDAGVWLAIHGANTMGETPTGQKVSKMTLQERVDWVMTHSVKIERAGEDPLADTWWAIAEDPLQFFAFCVEWMGYVRAWRKGEQYVCSLAVNMDGTCNGLQHFSAMLKDEEGAAAVNITPQDQPQDIYHQIALRVKEKLQVLGQDDPLAARWLHPDFNLVDRKLTKRPTMTFGYGSKKFGFKKQLKEELRKRDNWYEIKQLFTSTNAEGEETSRVSPACALMAGLIWDSLREIVVKAFDGMAWMQQAARGVVAGGKAVTWTVPLTGFMVKQEYVRWKRQQIRTLLAGKIVRPSVWLETGNIDPIRQCNAVSPNIVHSLDAAALMLTVHQAQSEGVELFAMVHDSYGTTPSDCGVMARACRQAFVQLYESQDVIGSLHQQFAAQHEDPSECPSPPDKGSLEVSQVLVSDYFFA